MTQNEEAQSYELMALTSIYEDLLTQFSTASSSAATGQLKIETDIENPLQLIEEKSSVTAASKNLPMGRKYFVEHLPPVLLNFTFPPDYPSKSPPSFVLSCVWMDRRQISVLCKKLDEIWEENYGCEILFIWFDFLKSQSLKVLNIESSLTLATDMPERGVENIVFEAADECPAVHIDARASLSEPIAQSVFHYVMQYHNEKELSIFNNKIFECAVCYLDQQGSNCIAFWPCKHVSCKKCMQNFFEIQIAQGMIKNLTCPETKCDSEASPVQVQMLVSPELYEKWDRLLLSSTLSSLPDIQSCPRKSCEYPVTVEKDQGHCPVCSFVFCGICRRSSHGVEHCYMNQTNTKEILELYQNGSPREKALMETRYGKRQLTKMLNEHLSVAFIGDNTKDCPNCKASIEKIDGCHKMTCNRCKTNWCWLCNKKMSQLRPYDHYNDPKSTCYNRLFEGAFLDDNRDHWIAWDEEGGGGLHPVEAA